MGEEYILEIYNGCMIEINNDKILHLMDITDLGIGEMQIGLSFIIR